MPSDEQRKAMRELSKSLRAKAHFRYPIDGPGVIDPLPVRLTKYLAQRGPIALKSVGCVDFADWA